jgi:hypothetical protein
MRLLVANETLRGDVAHLTAAADAAADAYDEQCRSGR